MGHFSYENLSLIYRLGAEGIQDWGIWGIGE